MYLAIQRESRKCKTPFIGGRRDTKGKYQYKKILLKPAKLIPQTLLRVYGFAQQKKTPPPPFPPFFENPTQEC